MWVRAIVCLGAIALAYVGVTKFYPAQAQVHVLMECGAQYEAAKQKNRRLAGSWRDFFDACRTRLAEKPKSEEMAKPETKQVPAFGAAAPSPPAGSAAVAPKAVPAPPAPAEPVAKPAEPGAAPTGVEQGARTKARPRKPSRSRRRR
jgi:hypothetical protein